MVEGMKAVVALYMGGMGAKDANFHKQVFERMGHEALSDEVQRLFLDGRKDEATSLIPDELVHDMHIVGDAGLRQGAGGGVGIHGRHDPAAVLPEAAEVRTIAEVLA